MNFREVQVRFSIITFASLGYSLIIFDIRTYMGYHGCSLMMNSLFGKSPSWKHLQGQVCSGRAREVVPVDQICVWSLARESLRDQSKDVEGHRLPRTVDSAACICPYPTSPTWNLKLFYFTRKPHKNHQSQDQRKDFRFE